MRIRLFVTLLLATSAAFAADLTFDQVQALASKDAASLNGDQTYALALAQSKASSAALAKCPQPVRAGEYEPFVILMEIDASGKATRSWLHGNSAIATCFKETMSHAMSYKPPHVPFYSSYQMTWQH